jgi:hypothetical protein
MDGPISWRYHYTTTSGKATLGCPRVPKNSPGRRPEFINGINGLWTHGFRN